MGRIGRSNARVEITSSASKFDVGLRDARKKLAGFGGYARKALGAVGGLAGKIGSGLSMGLGMSMFDGIGSVVGDVMETEKALTRLQIAGSRTPAQMDALRASLSDVASTTGIARQELIAGASAYVALTGDADGASQAVGLFAKVANATGASMDDIAATAASMKDNLKIDPKDFEAAFSALHVQGKAGAVELRELATVMAGVAPQFANFDGGSGAGGLAELGSVLQVVRKEFGSTSEAATGTRALIASLTRGSAKLKNFGIEVFNKDGSKRNFTEIIDEVVAAGLTEPQLQKILGSDEALRAIGALKTHRALLGDIRAASSDTAAIDRDAATFRESSAGKLQIAMATLKVAIADAFTPERIQAFVGAITTVLDTITKIVDGIGAVGKGLGEAVAGQVEKPGMAAQIVGGATGSMGAYSAISQVLSGPTSDGLTPDQARARADRVAAQGTAQVAKMKVDWAARRAEAKAAGIDTNQAGWAAKNFERKQAAITVQSTLVVDGNKVAAAVGNAKDQRRKP